MEVVVVSVRSYLQTFVSKSIDEGADQAKVKTPAGWGDKTTAAREERAWIQIMLLGGQSAWASLFNDPVGPQRRDSC